VCCRWCRRPGFDLIWFGIFVVLIVEMAQITPPVGFNLFVLQTMSGHGFQHGGEGGAAVLFPAGAGRRHHHGVSGGIVTVLPKYYFPG
jgi:hypothetical protein